MRPCFKGVSQKCLNEVQMSYHSQGQTASDEKHTCLQAHCYPQIASPHFASGEREHVRAAARHVVPIARRDKNEFPGQGSYAWEALDLIPHGALQGAVRKVFFHWQTASSKSREGSCLSSRRNLGKHICCLGKSITMRNDPGDICFERIS